VTLKAQRTPGFPVVTVGDHVKAKRLELALFQRQAAKLLGICQTTVMHWEKGQSDVPIRAYPAILAFLGYDPHSDPTTLAERLQAIRRRKGWKVRKAAKSIGVDEDTWRLWESGRAPSQMHHRVLRELLAREAQLAQCPKIPSI
jgi:DNA-binding transcriptional regulator YiaG